MLKGYCSMDRIRTQLEFDFLVSKSKEDSHGVFLPTHVIRKKTDNGDDICGYVSLAPANAAFVFAWFSTQQMQPRESFHIINNVENLVAMSSNPNNKQYVCWPIPKNSPFFEIMESMGYKANGEYTFFTKEV